MDRLNSTNSVILCGTVSDRPIYSHTIKGRDFYAFPMTVPRLSGTEDRINIICQKELLQEAVPDKCAALMVTGELRSHNNKSGSGNKLQIFVYAYELNFSCEAPANQVYLAGTLCKDPKLRITPLGREICDLLLAVNRPLGRSDYLPCISWGKSARETADFHVGDSLILEGRIQSRDYIKIIDGQQFIKTAYEVSAMEIIKESE